MVARTETAVPSPRSRRWPYFVLAAAVAVAAAAGAGLGYFLRFNLPDVRALEDYRPPVMTQVLDADGNLIETFAEQHRIVIGYGDIPQVFLQALLAVEDTNFLDHTGIDFRGVARALWRDLTSMSMAQGATRAR
jgi:penicillin-binding protein 1A